jgi:hypothetical protein
MTYDESQLAPLPGLTALIERHGRLAVGLAFLRAALARRRHPPDLDMLWLSPHLRRDLGLPPFLREDGPIR